jgi:hypothetical protein
MRKLLIPAWAVALVLGGEGRAPAQEAARAVVERAIKAHGGLERLSRVRADRVRLKGTLLLGTTKASFVSEVTVQLPAQFRMDMQLTTGDGKKHTLVQIQNGDKVLITLDGQPQKVEPAAQAEMRAKMELDRAVRLVPLLTDRALTLTPLGESRGGDRTVVGVKVTAKGRAELRLYFDKDTALLVKTEHLLTDGAGREVREEGFFSDFRDLGGYKRPVKVAAYREGKKVMEAELLDVQYLDKVDDAVFSKP